MKKMFLVGAGVAMLTLIGCNSTQSDVSMTETSGKTCCEKGGQCPEAQAGTAASPGVVGEKSHCEGQTGECPFSKKN